MIKELETVVLRRDIPQNGLKRGDVGVIVHRYGGGDAYEVEFVSGGGKTIAVLTLSEADLRPIMGEEILHVRELAS